MFELEIIIFDMQVMLLRELQAVQLIFHFFEWRLSFAAIRDFNVSQLCTIEKCTSDILHKFNMLFSLFQAVFVLKM